MRYFMVLSLGVSFLLPASTLAAEKARVRVEVGSEGLLEVRAVVTDERVLVLEGTVDTPWTDERSGALRLPYGRALERLARELEGVAEPPARAVLQPQSAPTALPPVRPRAPRTLLLGCLVHTRLLAPLVL